MNSQVFLSERVILQQRQTVITPFGPRDTWSNTETDWASVTYFRDDTNHQQMMPGSHIYYRIVLRKRQNVNYQKSRFIWTNSGTGEDRILQCTTTFQTPGRGNRLWTVIHAEDVTDKESPKAPETST